MRRALEAAMTIVVLAACGDTLPATPDEPDASIPDGGTDGSDATVETDGAGDASADVGPGSLCESPSAVTVPTGCASPATDAQPAYVRCSTFDDDASPPNVASVSNGTFAVSSEAISPPNAVSITTLSGVSDVRVASEVGPTVFNESVLEADIRLDKLGTRFVLFEVAVTQQIGGTQFIELWVEENGTLSAAASLSVAGFEDAGASAAGAALCPNRWVHVKLELVFDPNQVHFEAKFDGRSASGNLSSHILPGDTPSSAIGYVGVRTVEPGSKGVKLDVDNVQLYVQ